MDTILKFFLEYWIITGGVALFKALGWLGLGVLAWPSVFAVGLAWLLGAVILTCVVGLVTAASE